MVKTLAASPIADGPAPCPDLFLAEILSILNPQEGVCGINKISSEVQI